MIRFRAKLKTKLTFLILAAGLLAILLFQFLWTNNGRAWEFFRDTINRPLHILPEPDEAFWTNIQTEARKYDAPVSTDDSEAIESLQPFFDLADKYTSIYIYGLEDGAYRAGRAPEILSASDFRMPFDFLYRWTNGAVEKFSERSIEFKNGYALVLVYFYHNSIFILFYCFACIALCVALFLGIILFFINRKLREITCLNQSILQMASGSLTSPIPSRSHDELGILARELDHLRVTLIDNIRQEEESRKANQDLITALSHDLRTPLTILNGYLEVLQLKRCPEMQDEYLKRCLRKTDDIRKMTDRMFEYALVFEERETPKLTTFSTEVLSQYLHENLDFIHLGGFTSELALPDFSCRMLSDETMLKRIFNNLFSNIIKYGSKKEPVTITGSQDSHFIKLVLRNAVKPDCTGMESTQIGLKSVQKMLELLDGEFSYENEGDFFTATLRFPIL